MRKRFAIAIAALTALGLTVAGRAQTTSKMQLLSQYVWKEDIKGFGGLSGLELADNGRDFLALTDRMTLIEGQLQRSGGKISGVNVLRHARLKTPEGVKLKGWQKDSEGLARLPDGTLYISLERINQVWRYGRAFGAARRVPSHQDFRGLAGNAGLETLAVDQKGRIYAVPEVVPKSRTNLPLYRMSAKGWDVFAEIEARDGFDPVGADFGPDGLFYMLERKFSGIGFRSRLRRFDLAEFDPAGEGLLTTGLGTHDNLEGVSGWRDTDGVLRVTMMADDNFKFFQRSEIVEYALPLAEDVSER
jgi:hypothetical protein